MAEKTIYLTILLMVVVTVIPRMVPFLVFSGRQLPDDLVTWLKFVPVAVLAAMLGPELLWKSGTIHVGLHFWAALPAFLVGYFTRNLFVTVIAGMGSLAILRGVIG